MAWAELPVTRRVVRGIAFGCALVLSVAATTSCGADVPSKADDDKMTKLLAQCIVDRDVATHPNTTTTTTTSDGSS